MSWKKTKMRIKLTQINEKGINERYINLTKSRVQIPSDTATLKTEVINSY